MNYKDNLQEYIDTDIVYQNYLSGNLDYDEANDFEKFCINHCLDIDTALEMIKYKDKQINKLLEKEKEDEGYIQI